MSTRLQEGYDVYSEYMHITWFKGPDSVSKHLDGEVYDKVVAGNLADRRISLWGVKNICCQNGNPYQRIQLWCGIESFPISAAVVVPSCSFHCQLHGLTNTIVPC
jgi:hypothetical protein